MLGGEHAHGVWTAQPTALLPGFLGQQFYCVVRLCSLLASPVHHRQERAESGQNHSADAQGEEALGICYSEFFLAFVLPFLTFGFLLFTLWTALKIGAHCV